MHLIYRPALPSDAQACVTLRGKTRENAVSERQLRARGITADSWGDDIRTGVLPGYACIVGEDLVGYCFGSSGSGEIVVLAVLPDFEKRGIGRELLARMTRHLARLGHKRLYLGCSPDPECRSYGFYRHLGWRSTNTFDEHGDEILEIYVVDDP